MNQYIRPCISVLAGMLLISTVMDAQTVSSWKTAAGQSQLFQKQDDVHFSGKAQNNPVIRLDEAIRYQSMEGFGWTMTEGSAYWLMQLPDNERKSILEELFSVEKGLG
ncbi:MAG: hypothetical protein LBG77_05370, partial [Dysgonamonadaceae bacterium]|nr:hypothetical protein [Dysgonamonadaceae bacterium]